METGLRRLRYFHVLAEELSFRRSAARLGLTQPALSRAIALLEQDVGTQLFERSNREVSLTLAGKSFAVGCERVLSALDGAITQARKVADGYAGSLVIGYTDTAIAGRLPDIVQAFRVANPDIEIALRQAYTQAQYELLANGQIDVGFLTGPVHLPHCESVDIQRDRFVAVLPKGHRLAGREALALADLAEEPFVLGDYAHWNVYHDQLFALCRDAGFQPRVVQTAPDSRGILGLVSCGMGVSVQTEGLMQDGDRRVAFRQLDDCNARLTTVVAWNKRYPQPIKARLMEHVGDFALR